MRFKHITVVEGRKSDFNSQSLNIPVILKETDSSDLFVRMYDKNSSELSWVKISVSDTLTDIVTGTDILVGSGSESMIYSFLDNPNSVSPGLKKPKFVGQLAFLAVTGIGVILAKLVENSGIYTWKAVKVSLNDNRVYYNGRVPSGTRVLLTKNSPAYKLNQVEALAGHSSTGLEIIVQGGSDGDNVQVTDDSQLANSRIISQDGKLDLVNKVVINLESERGLPREVVGMNLVVNTTLSSIQLPRLIKNSIVEVKGTVTLAILNKISETVKLQNSILKINLLGSTTVKFDLVYSSLITGEVYGPVTSPIYGVNSIILLNGKFSGTTSFTNCASNLKVTGATEVDGKYLSKAQYYDSTGTNPDPAVKFIEYDVTQPFPTILESSPLIDACDSLPQTYKVTTDMYGRYRGQGNRCTIGPVEFSPSSVYSINGKVGKIDKLEIADTEGLRSDLDSRATKTELTTHLTDYNNPHKVTKDQVGLGNVDNTSDEDKPLSLASREANKVLQADIDTRATKVELENHATDYNNPHKVTKAQVGLGNVDNTADIDKPISTAVQAEFASVNTALTKKADLDSTGKVPTSQLPDSVLGALKYQGVWDASTNTPNLQNNSPENEGHYYIVNVEGINLGAEFEPGDWVVNSKGNWVKVDNVDAVKSVNGMRGIVVIGINDIAGLSSSLAEKAIDSAVVHRTGAESIEGAKTFTQQVTVPSATADEHAINRAQAKDIVKEHESVHTVAGRKGDIVIAVEDVVGFNTAMALKANNDDLVAHVANQNNPHNVTKKQVGLGKVLDLAPSEMPVSEATRLQIDRIDTELSKKATRTDIETHLKDFNNPHKVTADQVGLGNLVGFNPTQTVDDLTTKIDKKADKDKVYTKDEVEEKLNQITSGLTWKPSVQTFDGLAAEYPNAEDGWTATVLSNNYTYRFEGSTSTWEPISGNAIPNATTTTDGKMSHEDKAKLDDIEAGAQANKPGFGKVVIDGANVGITNPTDATSPNDKLKFKSGRHIEVKALVTGEVEINSTLKTGDDSEINARSLGGKMASEYALDTKVVHTEGDETIAGNKNFTVAPTMPQGTNANNPVLVGTLNDYKTTNDTKVDGKINKVDLLANDGRILPDKLPSGLIGIMRYMGQFDPTVPNPTVVNGNTDQNGEYYVVKKEGTYYGTGAPIELKVGDWLINHAGIWEKFRPGGGSTYPVESVNGQTGAVVIGIDDIAGLKTKLDASVATAASASAHLTDYNNPHKVTAEQVGAYTKETIDTKVTEVNNKFEDYAKKDTVYTKEEIDTKLNDYIKKVGDATLTGSLTVTEKVTAKAFYEDGNAGASTSFPSAGSGTSSGIDHSQGESATGDKWIDGKPMFVRYVRVTAGSFNSGNPQKLSIKTDDMPLNTIDTLIELGGGLAWSYDLTTYDPATNLVSDIGTGLILNSPEKYVKIIYTKQ